MMESAAAASAVGVAKSVAGKAAITKLALLFATGAVGAGVMAIVRPLTFRQLFAQALVAGVVSVYFTDSVVEQFAMLAGHAYQVAFLLGAMSWGLVGAAVRLRDLVGQRGGDAVAHAVGLDEQKGGANG